jgi:hypothetical protein
MNNINKSLSVNETYIIDSIEGNDIMSACTALYSNEIISCSGNTAILLQNGVISFNGNILAPIVSGGTFYGDGSNLTGISTQDTYVTGGTYSNGTATFVNNTGGTFNVSGFYTGYTAPTDVFVTGGTFDSVTGIAIFTNNTGGTFSISGFVNTYTTGVTFNSNVLTIYRNDGAELTTNIDSFGSITATTYYGDGSNLTGISTQDTFVTGGTYSDGTADFTNNTGGTFSVTGFTTPFTGGTVNGFTNFTDGLNTTTISAATYYNLPRDIRVTGGTYSNGTAVFRNNAGGTFNVSGFYTNFTGGVVSGLTATTISATTYENLPKIKYIINVAKEGGDFTSIKDAVDSILDSNSENRYVIKVAPGRYVEDEIILQGKEFISIVGTDILETLVVAGNPTQNIFTLGNNNELSFMTLSGATSGVAISCVDMGGFSLVHKISIYDCDTNVLVKSENDTSTFYGEYIDFNGEYSFGTKILALNELTAYANIENYYNYPTGTGVTIANSVQGSGATLSVFVGDGIGNGVSGSTNYQISDYASLNTISTTAYNWGYGVRVLNIGGPSRFDIDSYSVVDSLVYDLSVEHAGTFGTFGGGSATHTKLYNLSDTVYWAFLDTKDGEFEITRKISVTFKDNTHTDASTLIFKGSTMGLMSGGIISNVSGLTVNVASGFGYLQKTVGTEIYMRIDWENTLITLLPNINEYLYFNENEILSTSGSRPNSVNNIVLGRVVTNSSSVSFIDDSPLNADHTSNRFGSLFREALGPIYAFGSIVTEGSTPFTLDVTSGEYYFSSNEYKPTGGTGLTFTQYYSNGIGGWNTSNTTLVNNTQFDNNGILSGLTASAYTKHTLYIVGSGVNEKYMLVLGQNQYATLVETENALLPTPPTYFNDSVAQIANIYVRQGVSNVAEIEDIRPVIGFKAGGINASSLHANLLGLTSDDHKQYLLVDGSRAMSNNLDMGGNAIVSALTVNGVTVEAHASRHQNGGDDEIATDTPAPSQIPKADTFGKLDGWISDASNTVKGLTTLSLDPDVATNPIAVGVNDPRFLNSITGVTNTNDTITFTNNTGGTFSFTNAFLRNQTNASTTDTITINQSIFNPSNLIVLNTSIFIIESGADYYVLGDLTNNGVIIVDGTLKIGGELYNSGIITGSGTIE